jgi:hypothetical protein
LQVVVRHPRKTPAAASTLIVMTILSCLQAPTAAAWRVVLLVAFGAAAPDLEARIDEPRSPGARSLDHAVMDAVHEAAPEISECAKGDDSSGDVILDVRTDAKGRPALSSWRSASVSAARARCIEAAVRTRLMRAPDLVGNRRVEEDVPIGG